MARLRVAKIRASASGGGVPGFAAGLQMAQNPMGQWSNAMQTMIGDVLRRRIAEEEFTRNIAKTAWLQDLITERSEKLANQKHGRDLLNAATLKLNENPSLSAAYNIARESIPGWNNLPMEGRVAGLSLLLEQEKNTPELLAELGNIITMEFRGQHAIETGDPAPEFNVNEYQKFAEIFRSRIPPKLQGQSQSFFDAVFKRLGRIIRSQE